MMLIKRSLLGLFVVLTAALSVRADPVESEEHWYVIQMQGQRAGWMHERVATDGDAIKTESKMRLTIKRGELGISISVESGFVETKDGKPVSMRSVMQLGAMPTTTEYTFQADGVAVRSIIGKNGKPQDKEKQPLPAGEWRTPRAAERYMTERIAAGDKTISVRTIDPLTGLKPMTATHELLERTNLEVIGKTVPAFKWKSTTDAYPDLSTVDYTDERGGALRTETDIGGIKLTVIRADKDLATADVDPPELLVSTLIKPDKPIEGPRTVQRAVYTLRSTGPTLPEILTSGPQKFERLDAASGRLTVDLAADATPPAPPGEAADAAFSLCSNMITCGEREVADLVPEALAAAGLNRAPQAPAHERAEALRAFVYKYIDKKSLGVGFASAAEVARTRTGDCSEHGVLLCALLRADKIPARVVSGLVYVDGFAGEQTVFGYHMWAQALIEQDGKMRWLDYDAALSSKHRSDATHIALAPSALDDGDTANALVKLAPLIGTLKIEVEEVK